MAAPQRLRRPVVETLHATHVLTDREAWAGLRFRQGYRIVNGGPAIGPLLLDDRRRERPAALALPRPIERLLIQGQAYRDAVDAMDELDAGEPVTSRVVIAVVVWDNPLGDVDRGHARRNGWAAGILRAGLATYLRLFGSAYYAEVPAHVRIQRARA